MFLAAQLVSIITIITTIIGLFLKDKFKVLIWLTLTNISMLVVYLLLGRYLGCLLVGGATVRTFIYFFCAKFNKKPQLIFVISFEIYFAVISLFLWKDYSDLFMLANLCLLTYTTWQNNMSIFRWGYVYSGIFLITYDILVGAYIGSISEIILMVSSIWSLVKYSYLNKINDSVLHYYSTLSPFYDTNISNKGEIYFVTSSKVDDKYNNICYVKNAETFDRNFQEIKKYFADNNKKPIIYLQTKERRDLNNFTSQMKGNKLLFQDSWMQLRTSYQAKKINCLIDGVVFKLATKDNMDDFLSVFEQCFVNCKENEIYKYSKEYCEMYKEGFEKISSQEEHFFPYIAYLNDKPIGILSVFTNGINAYICHNATIEEYRRKGVASSLMSFCINDQKDKGVENFYIITQKYTYLETFYMKNNFEEISTGLCFSIKKTH